MASNLIDACRLCRDTTLVCIAVHAHIRARNVDRSAIAEHLSNLLSLWTAHIVTEPCVLVSYKTLCMVGFVSSLNIKLSNGPLIQ